MEEQQEITIGHVTYELNRFFIGKQPLSELLQAQIERKAAAFDKDRKEAV